MKTFSRRALRAAALGLLVAALSGCLNPDAQQLLDSVNGLRGSTGAGALQQQEAVNARAQQWAEHLAARGGLAHSNLRTLPVPFARAAENVGYGTSIQQVHAMLAASPAHRGNMLDHRYSQVGVGTAWGRNGNIYAVEIFIGH